MRRDLDWLLVATGLLVLLLLVLMAYDVRAQSIEVLHVEHSVTVCPTHPSIPCPDESFRQPQHFPLATQPTDPAHLLPPRATVAVAQVGGIYGVGVGHCRLLTAGFLDGQGEWIEPQPPSAPEAKSPVVNLSVVPVSNGKETTYMLRVAPQPCMTSPWELEMVVIEEVMP